MVVGRLTAVSCYLDQAPLSSLIPTSPPLLPRSPRLSRAQPWCACNGQLWKPKPSLLPSLLPRCTMGTCFLAFTPSQDKTRTHTHTHTQSHPPHALVRLFLYSRGLSLSLSLSRSLVQGRGDQVSTVLCLLFCSGVQRRAVSLHISFVFFFNLLSSPTFPLLSFFFNVIFFFFLTSSFSLVLSRRGVCAALSTFFLKCALFGFPLQTTREQQ